VSTYEKLATALNSQVIAGVDVARALAILCVLCFHWRLLPISGPMGVMIFFVLSGFLITSMLLREHQRSGTISLRTFYMRRAFRILPTFYVCWIITAILFWATKTPTSAFDQAASFFYLEDYFRALHPALQTAAPMWISWSLAVEEQFYFIWPILLLLIATNRRRMIMIVSTIVIAVWINRAVLMLGFGVTWIYLYNAFDTRVDALMLGSLLAVLVREEKTARCLTWSLHRKWFALAPILLLTIITAIDRLGFSTPRRELVAYMVEPLIIAFMLLQFIFWGYKDWSWFQSPLVRFIARISYSLYLYHIPIWMFTDYLHRGRRWSIPLTFAVSTASYLFIERPFMHWRDRGKRQQSPLTSLTDSPSRSM
jgi:peptidoglycan/LPS O-acetylase OafA/YrhL